MQDAEEVSVLTLAGLAIEQFPNGIWSWSFDTGQAKSQLVYVTATDSNGLKGQTVFQGVR